MLAPILKSAVIFLLSLAVLSLIGLVLLQEPSEVIQQSEEAHKPEEPSILMHSRQITSRHPTHKGAASFAIIKANKPTVHM